MQQNDHLTALLEEMWLEHSTFLKYLLVGLTHDLNLADDLLQDAYLNARAGIAGYAGGSSRAWLAQIAKRVFFSHRRRRYIRVEEPLDTAAEEADNDEVGSPEHLRLIEIRRAVAELDPSLRAALVMKHYGGLTYNEIAERQHCPVGTVKWRVSSALDRLRAVLVATEEESGRMGCEEVRGTPLVDYVYQLLSPEAAERVRSHLASCPSCRTEAETLRKIARALDAFDQESKSQVFYELDEKGVPVVYGFMSWQNSSDKPIDVVRFGDTGTGVRPGNYLHVAVEGEPQPFEVEVAEEDRVVYTTKLKRPMEPGERRDGLVVYRSQSSSARQLPNAPGVWLFRPGLIIADPGEVEVRVEAVRLPPGAKLLSCSPQPDELRTNETTTLVWRRVLAAWETFALVVVYQLEPQ